MKDLLVIHGGAPTAVMNASLCGVVKEARRHGEIGRILGASGGTGGAMREEFIDLTDLTDAQLEKLLHTPASAIGTSRDPLYEKEYARLREVFLQHNIGYVLFNGGNGTMDACGHTRDACAQDDVRVVGIPKTIDNDIAVTDHAPGFGSAAKYLAATVAEVTRDVRALPIHVCILEAMGRNAGWLTAASALARDCGSGPDLIYLPERAFDEAQFLKDVQRIHEEKGGVVVVASEGLHYADGTPIVEPIFRTERAVYFGDVGAHLCSTVIKHLGIKARSEKPGICGRASDAWQSDVDREEAVACGEEAVRLAAAGRSGVMVTLTHPEMGGTGTLGCADVHEVMMVERKLPDDFINEAGNDVTQAYLDWLRPLVGGGLPEYAILEGRG